LPCPREIAERIATAPAIIAAGYPNDWTKRRALVYGCEKACRDNCPQFQSLRGAFLSAELGYSERDSGHDRGVHGSPDSATNQPPVQAGTD
jgi:hypothetical protein